MKATSPVTCLYSELDLRRRKSDAWASARCLNSRSARQVSAHGVGRSAVCTSTRRCRVRRRRVGLCAWRHAGKTPASRRVRLDGLVVGDSLRRLAARVIGSIRRECLGHVIVFNESGLRRVLRQYVDYHHRSRTHIGLAWRARAVGMSRTAKLSMVEATAAKAVSRSCTRKCGASSLGKASRSC
jgi:hypothetical protein